MHYRPDDFNPYVVSSVRCGDVGILDMPGAFQPPKIELRMSEIANITLKLNKSGRWWLAERLASVATMHNLVVEGTNLPPAPVILDGEPARQIQTVWDSPELPADEPVYLYTHEQVVINGICADRSVHEPVAA